MRTVVTADLTAEEADQLRSLLDEAFAGGFGDDDWSHALGGVQCSPRWAATWPGTPPSSAGS